MLAFTRRYSSKPNMLKFTEDYVGNQQKWDTFVKERSGGGSTLYVSAKVCGGQLVSLPGQHISRSNAHLTPKRRIRYY